MNRIGDLACHRRHSCLYSEPKSNQQIRTETHSSTLRTSQIIRTHDKQSIEDERLSRKKPIVTGVAVHVSDRVHMDQEADAVMMSSIKEDSGSTKI